MGATLTYLGHSTFIGQSDGGQTFYIDPGSMETRAAPRISKARKRRT